MASNIDYRNLYDKIERIAFLESRINKKSKLEYGDEEVIELHGLVSSLPVLSENELIEYQMFIFKEIFSEKKSFMRDLKENFDEINDICYKSNLLVESVLKKL